jgi:hypothetical protein
VEVRKRFDLSSYVPPWQMEARLSRRIGASAMTYDPKLVKLPGGVAERLLEETPNYRR